MGSIDENAIQSLSFVINLSKHIQLKASEKEDDPEDLAQLFPSFLWVLRDFALQLVDDSGDNITPKEYLEKVLDTSKAFYEQDQKNKIRKLIKTYFRDRDCFTMVRPLMKETDLQNLESMPPEKLRPEFLEQILSLRKKVLGRIKTKTIKSKALNGEMYLGIVKNLINCINSGRVPNIENTWTSMCKVESFKAFEEAEKIYEIIMKENIDSAGFSEEILKKIHTEAKEKSIAAFRSKSVGEVAIDYEKILKSKIKDRLSYYTKLNLEETRSQLTRLLQKWYSVLEYKIQNCDLKNVDEIEYEFRQLEFKLNENFPNNNEIRNELFSEFKSRVLNFAGEFFLNKMNNEINLIKNENEQVINQLNNQLNETRTNYETDLTKKNTSIDQMKAEITELKNQLGSVKENLVINEKERDQDKKNLISKVDRLKEQYDRQIEELNKKLATAEEAKREAERKALTIQAEAEKEKALMDQKIDHMNKQIEDFSKREKENSGELKSQLREQANALKETTSKYESQLKQLNTQNEQLKEKIVDLESMLSEKEHLYEMEKNKADDLATKYTLEKEEFNDKINGFKSKLENEKNKYQEELKSKEYEFNSKVNLMKIKQDELEHKLKVTEETSKAQISKLERENAILKQNLEFAEIQNKEFQSQIEEMKKNHETILSTLESKAFSMVGHDELQKKIDEIKSYFENEKKQMEESFEKSKNMYVSQIDSLTEKLNEVNYKNKINNQDLENELNETKMRLDKATKELQTVSAEKKKLIEDLNSYSGDNMNKIRSLNEEFERKMAENDEKHHKEIVELNRNSEETIAQLKSIFESEKIRFEEKLKEEKAKYEKKMKYNGDEWESKMREIESDLRDELEQLQMDYNDLETTHQQYIQNSEHEIGILGQRNETLEAYLKDTREALNQLQIQSAQNLEQASENFNRERKEYMNKIEQLTLDYNNKEKEITSLQLKRDQLDAVIADKDNTINSMRKEFDEERKELNNKIEHFKQKYQESNDEYMLKKLESTREIALLKQQIEFLNKKIDDQNRIIDESQKRYEERLYSLRSEVEKDLNEKFERLRTEKEELEKKLLQKKKEVRDLEQNFLKQSNMSDKEKSILLEKLMNYEDKKKEILSSYEKEIEALNNTIKSLREGYSTEKDDLVTNNEKLKTKITQLENVVVEKTISIEREQVLWENKFKFIEQQRDNLKKELSDAQKRFEQLLDNIQTKGNKDKENLQSAQQNALTTLEQKYQIQIKEMQDNHQKLYLELVNTNKELDRQVKSLMLQVEMKGKGVDPSNLSRRIDELIAENEKLKKDYDDIIRSKDLRNYDSQNNVEREKEMLKNKISDYEIRLRELESKRGAYMLEYEKEKAKWGLEKDHYICKNQEYQETIDKLERRNETLLRENEKLKANNQSRKSGSIVRDSMIKNTNVPKSYANFTSNLGKYDIYDRDLNMLKFGTDKSFDSTNIDSKGENKFLNKFPLNKNITYSPISRADEKDSSRDK